MNKTWEEFKKTVEDQGLKDDDVLTTVYYDGSAIGNVKVVFEKARDPQGRRVVWIEFDQ